MDEKSIAYATYWRTSLADAELSSGALKKSDASAFKQGTEAELESGRLGKRLTAELFAGEAEDVEKVAITIRPYVYNSHFEHGQERTTGVPQVVTTIVSQARVDRSGRIYPNSKTFIPRDILEPLDRGSFSIGTVSDLDRWLEGHQVPEFDGPTPGEPDTDRWHSERWQKYLGYCKEMLDTVTDGWPGETEPFQAASSWLLAKTSTVSGASLHILKLYDHLRAAKPYAPLLDNYASEVVTDPEPCLPSNAGFSLRLGHASDSYPLSDAQRDAMTHQLVSEHGEIIAVNGPPGTGKTTLVLSVVASHWVRAALDGTEPLVIAAASTNNQAVTNIIDSFAKDFATGTGAFAGRWLPDIKSFGAYFASSDKEKQLAGKYQTKAFFNSVEDLDYTARAEAAYLKAASAAFPNLEAPTVQAVVDQLRQAISGEYDKLVAMEAAWNYLRKSMKDLLDELGADFDAALGARQQAVADSEKLLADLATFQHEWESYLARESLFYTLFSWLPPVARKRLLLAKVFAKRFLPATSQAPVWSTVEEISTYIDDLFTERHATLRRQQEAVRAGTVVILASKVALEVWRTAAEPVSLGRLPGLLTLADCDRTADTVIRFPAFLLATHYWEGRWLLEMKGITNPADEKKKKGAALCRKRWHRRMMLTPCIVSTFYMLPGELVVSRHDKGEFITDYLYDFIDLLIVDEAGQVLPEVAGASFSLAKRAMVIGDTLQIEPIWSIQTRVDIGNLLFARVLTGSDVRADYNRLCDLGKTAASGSVMRIAQAASRYHYDPDLARGMFLFEHRRCFDEIIKYCNTLCYHGKLQAMRGTGAGAGEGALPALGYLHINGICQRSGSGSRQNLLEAETIAAWILEHQRELEARYGRAIGEIVGVVTPFGGQVAAITRACLAQGLSVGKRDGELTVGTVHSLQGAERAIVIFSPTYSIHADGPFIDNSPSMLNVAVSRAKDAFLVFGDMDIFNPNDKGSPRGQLATALFAEESNALHFSPLPRKDICPRESDIGYLLDADQHDAFLMDALTKASREVHIVSPWIRQQRITEVGILSAMVQAVSRGVTVTVYADQSLNLDSKAKTDQDKRRYWANAAKTFGEGGITLVDVLLVHSKIVARDNEVLCVGSFNWLSAVRNGQYTRHETSIFYTGPKVGEEVSILLQSLIRRRVGITK
jgi:hypothetical protein